MSWIKRNLFFVIGSLVALGLLAWAGFYNFSRWKLNSDAREKLNEQYKELTRLNGLNPHPGNNKVDNIEAARKQRDTLTNVIVRAAKQFQPIASIPTSDKLTSKDFAAALRQTIDKLQRDAQNASVVLPPQYSFSFSVERTVLNFTPGSLEPLSVQLGEISEICSIFNEAKVNSLDGIRRERVCAEDMSANAPATDYLDIHSQTNELAVISPYEVSFRCFSPELANVLAQFAGSPHGFVVKSVNIRSASTATASEAPAYVDAPMPVARPVMPNPDVDDHRPAFLRRGQPPAAYGATPVAAPAPTPAPNRGGLQTFISERQLTVTLLVETVKLLPKN